MIDGLVLSVILAFSVFGWGIVSEPGMPFGWLSKLVYNLEQWINRVTSSTIGELIHKPTVGCQPCISGQLSLWVYFIISDHYVLHDHLFFILMTIGINKLINKI